MRTFIKIISVFGLLAGLSSCKTNPTDTSYKSDMTRNVEELQKRDQTEKEKVDITSPQNNYGKPASK
ncbi:hypothetical protein KYG33_12635 [Chryseobacterium sp. D764]|jgi:hypothetical protein|uniref:hypothetical protein n=1 Tax=Chryseobacterium sp. D764 TaxID=2856522 RepID=UPI001C58B958|nr:hypothetical protein [Chryseobacterium sp. D764]QXU47656.1 hypothetical protein KYG33_12635 [Chryseobacterium sp. D764]